MKIRLGMHYKKGDIVLIKFPFSSLKKSKKRPVLLIKDENFQGDFVCFQITSKSTQNNLFLLKQDSFLGNPLPLQSFVKYDKCFTLHSDIVEKKLTSINLNTLKKITKLFCNFFSIS